MKWRSIWTTKCPHKDDISFYVNGVDMRSFGSQGQQRTAALAIKLSELDLIRSETGEWPILMLDDVMSELDERRQKYLLERILPVQTLVTTTTTGTDWPRARRFEVFSGQIQSMD